MQIGMPHPPLGRERLGEFLNFFRCASQNRDFQAAVMVQINLSAGDNQIVPGVMRGTDALCQLTRLMIEYMREGRHARGLWAGQAVIRGGRTNNVTQCLGTAAVTSARHQAIYSLEQILVNRDGNPLHRCSR